MVSLKVVAGASALVAVIGGAVWYDRGLDERLHRCEERAVRMATLPVLTETLDEVTARDLASGCDVDRVESYATRQFTGAVDRDTVLRYVRGTLDRDGWTVTTDDGVPLTAEKEPADGRRLSLRLDFPFPNTYEVVVTE